MSETTARREKPTARGRVAAIATLIVVLLAAGGHGKRPKPQPCPDGRFVLSGGATLIAGGTVPPIDAVVLTGRQLAIDSGCAVAHAKVKVTRSGTTVLARWKTCQTLRGVSLKATIAAPACDQMTGTRKAKGQKPVPFRAVRSRCGDGAIDHEAGERCERGIGCAAGEQCDDSQCSCTGLTSTSTTPTTTSSTVTTTLPPPVCGDAVVQSPEPCDPLAVPSGCPASQQCEVVGDNTCTCNPVPATIGRSVTVAAPPPPPDPASIGLPLLPGGGYLLNTTPDVQLVLRPELKDPVTAVGRCTRWIMHCLEPPTRTLDDCARSAPSCLTQTPWNEATDCCPVTCFTGYEALRKTGVAPLMALGRVYFEDGACFPGLRAMVGRE